MICKILLLFFTAAVLFNNAGAQCNQYTWTSWKNFSGTTATGTLINNGQAVTVSMHASFGFDESFFIINYPVFNRFESIIPDSAVPRFEWAPGNTITVCFSQPVQNPVLLFSALGDANSPATVHFSRPYWIVYDAGGITKTNDTSITGNNGNTVVLFPGTVTCLTITTLTAELHYGNITVGANPPLFPLNITGVTSQCDSVSLTASGGVGYSWNGGTSPFTAVNKFYSSGIYFVSIRNTDGCKYIAGQSISVQHGASLTLHQTICEGGAVLGYSKEGTYTDHFKVAGGCDSTRTLVLTVNLPAVATENKSVCEGDSYEGHTITGTYSSKLTAASGCDSIHTLHLTVVKKILPNLGSVRSIGTGDSLRLYPGAYDVYRWQNGSTQDHFLATKAGHYTVDVQDVCGAGSAAISIAEMSCSVIAPNAFSPNGDGINDTWMIPFLDYYPACKVEVFNRYGQRLFYSTGYSKPWNGMYNGKTLAVGTYYWMITLQPGRQPLHGSVLVIH